MEVLALSLKEDYRFPVLEIFAFFYTIATIFFVNANLSGMGTQFIKSEECLAFNLVEVLSGLPLFFILVLIVKNIAFGLGNDLEKGTMQTYLMYPLSRKSLLLVSSYHPSESHFFFSWESKSLYYPSWRPTLFYCI